MSSICSAKTIVAEEKFSIYDTLPALESWYQTNTPEDNHNNSNTCLRRITRRKNNKVVSFCPDPPTVFHDDKEAAESLLPRNKHYNNKSDDSISTGCCGNIKGKN